MMTVMRMIIVVEMVVWMVFNIIIMMAMTMKAVTGHKIYLFSRSGETWLLNFPKWLSRLQT